MLLTLIGDSVKKANGLTGCAKIVLVPADAVIFSVKTGGETLPPIFVQRHARFVLFFMRLSANIAQKLAKLVLADNGFHLTPPRGTRVLLAISNSCAKK